MVRLHLQNYNTRYSKYIRTFYATVILLVTGALSTYAQPGGPTAPECDPDDPSGCPLDTWVLLLVGATLVLTVIHLHRKQKAFRLDL